MVCEANQESPFPIKTPRGPPAPKGAWSPTCAETERAAGYNMEVKTLITGALARRFIAFLIAGVIVSLPLGAMGGREEKEEDKGVDVFLLTETESEARMFAIERMDLPSSLALFNGVRFSLRGGELSTDADSQFSAASKEIVSKERVNGFIILDYRVYAGFPKTAPRSASRTVYVSFAVKDCMGKKGGVLLQPARVALSRAVGASGIGSGFARIASLSHLGEGRFSAKVEVGK